MDLLLSRLREGMVDLVPDFRRRAGIWSDRAVLRLVSGVLTLVPHRRPPALRAGAGGCWTMATGGWVTAAPVRHPRTVRDAGPRARR